jgi:hypothetical protein
MAAYDAGHLGPVPIRWFTREDLLERFRGALERISVALGMPGSPDLAVDVPAVVEELLSIDDVNWRARELLREVKDPR